MPDLRPPPVRLDVAADLTSLGDVRAVVGETARRWGFRQAFDVEVVVTELVTNAIVHAGTRSVVTLSRLGARRMEIAVADGDTRPPVRVAPYEHNTRGHGLAIVEHLARSWGVRAGDDPGKTVWAQVEEERHLRLVDGDGTGRSVGRRRPARGPRLVAVRP
ncbi:MAG TPA: ATP-binding protein [Iamia sp.]|jgi:two-component sensor histidine kinase|nr:ATP-binding protein [Iamia sp.]